MKNKAYLIIDEKNDVIVNTLVSLTDDMAKQQITNNLKQSIYIFNNTNNFAEKAKILSYLTTCQDFTLGVLNDENELEKIMEYKEVLKPYQNILKITKDEIKNELHKKEA